MRIDSSNNINTYENLAESQNIKSSNTDSLPQEQSQTPVSQTPQAQEKEPNSNYFFKEFGANYSAFLLKQKTGNIPNNMANNPTLANSTSKTDTNQQSSVTTDKETKAVTTFGTENVSKKQTNPTDLDTKWNDYNGKPFPIEKQNKYNKIILDSVNNAKNPLPDFSPRILKAMVAKESSFEPNRVNAKGYTGLTQMGKSTAETEGKLSFANGDPRFNPEQIIPATLNVLKAKEIALEKGAGKRRPGFNYYGSPSQEDKLKFTLAAYNGGQGTVLKALAIAYPKGVPSDGVKYADVEKYLPSETRNYVKYITETAKQ